MGQITDKKAIAPAKSLLTRNFELWFNSCTQLIVMQDPLQTPRTLRFGIFEMDLGSEEIRKKKSKLKLSGQPFRMLATIARRNGHVVTYEELGAQFWPGIIIEDYKHSLRNSLLAIRKVLGDSAKKPRYIKTVSRGYLFLVPVEFIPTVPHHNGSSNSPADAFSAEIQQIRRELISTLDSRGLTLLLYRCERLVNQDLRHPKLPDLHLLMADIQSAIGHSAVLEEAWTEFVRRFQPLIAAAIAKVARRFGKVSNELVDDLVQEVFIKLCRDNFHPLSGVATTRDEKSLFGFLRVVAANVAHDHFRRARAFKAGGAHAEKQESIEAPELDKRRASSAIERGVLLEEMDRRLKTLSHEPNFNRNRAIFWFYYKEGLTATEIAALPDIKLSVKGVESTLLRLTRYIKSALTQETKKPKSKLWSKS
jgi:RNA polymerase sigma-70 factor (ECF subfamily)